MSYTHKCDYVACQNRVPCSARDRNRERDHVCASCATTTTKTNEEMPMRLATRDGWKVPQRDTPEQMASTPELIACCQCGNTMQQVTGTKIINERADATEVYRLACGHVTL